jgi:mRNA-degrading endonuclease toxin of MazEF toxin-antitoxin module
MVVVAPITSVERRLRHHVPIGLEAGLRGPSFVMPEYVRAIAQRRLGDRPLGTADQETLDAVEWWVTNFTSEG